MLDELFERQTRLLGLLDLTQELTSIHLRDDALRARIVRRSADLLAADAVALLLLDHGALVPRATLGDAASLFGAGSPALSAAVGSGTVHVRPTVAGGRAVLAVPLRTPREAVGVLMLARPADRLFSSDDVLLATKLARLVATALDNARIHGEVLEADHRKDDFLARLAHELRNPLAPLVNALHLLGHVAKTAPDVAQLHGIMARQARRLAALVDDLLDLSRIRLDKLAVSPEPVDLCEVARRCVENLDVSRRAAEHAVSASLPNEPIVVNGDPGRLEQIVDNLLDNAVKYTPRGGAIRLVVERTLTEAVLRVQDRGIGIAPEALPHVFELFMQAGGARHRARGGLGLGLALVRALVEVHKGTVTADSGGVGRGSEFTVRLPLSAVPLADAAREPGPRTATPEAGGSRSTASPRRAP